MVKISTAMTNSTRTENGDFAFKSTGNKMVDLLFYAPYLTKNPKYIKDFAQEVDSNILPMFAAFMRDPRFGMGYKVIGRELMKIADLDPEFIATVGRFDDLWRIGSPVNTKYLYDQCAAGNFLAKKWCPRFGSKNKADAHVLAELWGMNKQEYGHFVKCDSTERLLTEKRTDEIKFDQVSSLAAIKYAKRFETGIDTSKRYAKYKEAVKKGDADLKVTVTSPYDIYKNRNSIDPDMFFDKLMEKKKISISCMPIVDTSGSMCSNDAIGKALAIGHYLAKCSTYENGKIMTFSSNPHIIDLSQPAGNAEAMASVGYGWSRDVNEIRKNLLAQESGIKSNYLKEIARMQTGDCSNTDFAKVMDVLSNVDEFPDYLVVLSDMQFDCGAYGRKTEVQRLWKEKGYKTKIVWWNFNDRSMSVPEMDDMGNVYLSGYNPMLLQYLEAGFNAEQFIVNLLKNYSDKMQKEYTKA